MFCPQLIFYTSFTSATTQCYNSMVEQKHIQLFSTFSTFSIRCDSRAVECLCTDANVNVYVCLSDRIAWIRIRLLVHIREKSNTKPIEWLGLWVYTWRGIFRYLFQNKSTEHTAQSQYQCDRQRKKERKRVCVCMFVRHTHTHTPLVCFHCCSLIRK